MKSAMPCWWVVASAVLVSQPAAAETEAGIDGPREAHDAAADARSLRVYVRPYMGWGWKTLTVPEDRVNWYRLGFGLASGVVVSGFSLGIDVNYFNGTKGEVTLVDDAGRRLLTGGGRAHAFRLAADVGYDLRWRRLTVRPHFLAGVDWHRLTAGENFGVAERNPFWAPCLLALVTILHDESGLFAIGPDVRWNLVLDEGTVYTHFSAFIAAEARF
jgi:hypothetical protein